MTDRDVIWVCLDEFSGDNAWYSEKSTDGEVPYTPLSRATQLQRAMTVIAERCEELRADAETGKIEEGEVLKALIGTGEHARKALTEFERMDDEG